MTWNSGACDTPASKGATWISIDTCAEPVRITDAEVRAVNADVAGDLLASSSSK